LFSSSASAFCPDAYSARSSFKRCSSCCFINFPFRQMFAHLKSLPQDVLQVEEKTKIIHRGFSYVSLTVS
jgi:hypothetical protein